MRKKQVERPLVLHYLTVGEVESLASDPDNFRLHPKSQSDGLISVMKELEGMTDDGLQGRGFIAPLTFNERTDLLQDGHLRKDEINELPVTVDGRIPVLFGKWTTEQHRLALASRDPLTILAGTNTSVYRDILEKVMQDSGDDVKKLLEHLGQEMGAAPPVLSKLPDEFPEIDESLETEHECPKCGYKWSGSSAPEED